MRKLIRGKLDSQFKQFGRKLHRGYFTTPMQHACNHRGGMRELWHVMYQPWETWKAYKPVTEFMPMSRAKFRIAVRRRTTLWNIAVQEG